MSFFGSLETAVSGITAQSNRLNTIGTNVANVGTTGYKASDVLFQHVLGDEVPSAYRAGGVRSVVRADVTTQGAIGSTTSTTDLAVSGNGFFAVRSPGGTTAMTRAGAFVQDASGNLVNTAGYTLMGTSLTGGGLVPVNVPSTASSVTVATDGTVTIVDRSGTSTAAYQIPLATVESPTNLTRVTGDVFEANEASGAMTVGTAQSGARGRIESSALEASTVDIAAELSKMIVTQRSYEANSKVMTASSDLMSKLSQL